MKTSLENTPLDIFMKECLKANDTTIPTVDWSEIEVLLRREPKSIPVEINKKTAMYAIAGVLGILLIIGLVKTIQHYSSLPPDSAPQTNSDQSSFILTDTIKAAAIVDTIQNENSSSILNTNALADTSAIKINTDKKATIPPKSEKKKKEKNTQKDTSQSNVGTLTVPSQSTIDTSARSTIPVIKIDAPALIDSANKKNASPNNSSKKKKNKASKSSYIPPEQPLNIPTPALPSDSLK